MVPRSVGPYCILRPLGSGGMGEVFLAEDTRLKRRVALKSLTEDWAVKPDAQRRLLHEARAAAALNHPNIAAIYDVLQGEDGAYIVMEYVPGETLAERLATGPLPPGAVVWIGIQMCDALAEAHAHDIVHRDLKPKNLALTPDGRLKVLDFGLAKTLVVDPSGQETPSSAPLDLSYAGQRVVGTPPYLPPETLLGGAVDARSDLYSAGVVLYELLTGRRPFTEATQTALAAAILHDTPPKPSELNPQVPEAIERVVLKAMARNPAERYPAAAVMKADLERARVDLSDEPTISELGWIASRRGRRARKSSLVAIGALLLGVWLATLQLRSQSEPPRVASASTAALAIVPFENDTGDPSWTPLAKGVTDDLARELQKQGVPLKARESASQLSGLSDSEIARRLDVERILRGKIALDGDDILLDAGMTQSVTGARLWSRSYRLPLDRPGGLYLAVAADITALTGGPGPPEAAPGHHTSFKAYQDYHKGRVYWEQRTREGLLKSIEYFTMATELDPAYAQAWAGMADAYLSLGVPTFGAFPPQEARRLANDAALKALDLDPNLAEVHASLAHASYAYDWNWTAAEARFRKAIQINPQYATAHHWYADYLNAMGRQDEAMREIKTAFHLEPLSTLIHRDFAWHYFFQGKYEAAIAQLKETLKIDPRYPAARSLLGRALIEAGHHAEGLAELKKVAPDLPRAAALSFVAYGEASAGQIPRAEAILKQLLHSTESEYVSPYYIALVYVKLGRHREALAWLEKGFDDHDTTMTTLKVDPRFEPLRSEPRFLALVERMKFPGTRR